ncbi:unnamed protein product [Durusdinium trenchii]|uniref:UDP-N-acetylglucosamine kinase n=1 Tax=Durusdinium trenchii TaxID=1381693 RepID=A0ABP0Q3J5_9DINO
MGMFRASCCPRRWQWSETPRTSPQHVSAKRSEGDNCVIGASCASTESFEQESVESDDTPAPKLLPRELTLEERQVAWFAANFDDASGDQAVPIALWILGPSSVGKSTISVDTAPRFDIPCRTADNPGGDQRRRLDAVIIDGEFMRDAHGVWKEWIETDDWRSAYPALKAIINHEKEELCHEAVRQRKHLVIPQTALKLPKALAEMEMLIKSGYTNHVLAVVAPLAECQQRGWKRELTTGKRYQADEFQQSISAIPPLIASSNGRYAVVRARERSGTTHGMDFDVLQEGFGGGAVSGLSTPAPPVAMIEAAISRAVGTG